MARQYGDPPIDPRAPLKSGMQKPETKPKEKDPYPSAEEVRNFHRNSDLDASDYAQHHTLGPEPMQASPGNHTHDGGSSPLILDGYIISGSQSDPATVLPSILVCLTRLGVKDNTTA